MKTLFPSLSSRLRRSPGRLLSSALLAACVALPQTMSAAVQTASAPTPAARIHTQISDASRIRLKGTLHPLAQTRYDSGRVPSSTQLHGISMVFSRSAAQDTDLKALIKAQQTPSSPLYHKWLTPDEFAARFGMAQADLNAAEQWLKQQGFTVDRISRSRDRIYFSGTVAQIEAAFATQMHYYTVDGKKQFAPSTELSLPAALSGVVMNIGNLNSFRPKPMMHAVPQAGVRSQSAPKADFTSGTTGNHFVAPGDLATIYDVNAVYNAGWTGTGQSIAIAGESFIDVSDIEHFQTASGWSTPKDPTMVLVPDTGDDGVAYQNDEAESDLDLEWSSAMAPAATIFFVYTGGGGNANVFNSVEYAVDTRIAPIISLSYGGCEIAFQPSDIQAIEAIEEQGIAQGQTILVASGDDGASGCFRDTDLSTQDRTSLAVSYPASSPNVTAVGGTQFNEGSGSYWNSSSGDDLVNSAISYIPEVVWNEDSAQNGLGSSGGGVSILFTKPTWQTGVPGISADGARDVPDIALDSAGGHDGLLFCSSDTSFWPSGQQASCNNGFRDAASGNLTVAGGTSFATPIFAGMLALINQQQNSTGQGLINPALYTLASNASTYTSAFHDIEGGDNKCDTGESTFCPNGPTGYAAGTGYDLATGLGSLDLNNLMAAWGAPTSTGTTTTLALQTAVPSTTAPVQVNITVASVSGGATPTGTVSMLVDGTADPTPVTLSNGTGTYSTTLQGNGNHILVATYSGNTTFASSTNTLVIDTLPQTTVNISTSSNSPVIGQQATFTFTVQPTTGLNHPTGNILISVDGTLVASRTLSADSVANYSTSFTKLGQHSVLATYGGSNAFASSTSELDVNVVNGSKLTITPATLSPRVGDTDTFTVNVSPTSGSTLPTGTLRVLVDGQLLSPAPTLTDGSATFTAAFSGAGQHTVAVSYSGSDTFASATSTTTLYTLAALINTTTTVIADSNTPNIGAQANFTIAVAPAAGSVAPDGAITLIVDGVQTSAAPAFANGTATYSAAFTTAGTHTVTAVYSGSETFATSIGSATITVPPFSFALSGSTATAAQGSTGKSTITITPNNGYTGSISFAVSANSLAHACFALPSATVTDGNPVTSTLIISTNQASCPNAQAQAAIVSSLSPKTPGSNHLPSPRNTELSMAVAGAVIGLLGRRARKLRGLAAVLVLLTLGMIASGCGGGNGNSMTSTVDPNATPKGTYTITITGTDTATSTLNSTTSFTFTVN